MANLGMQTSMGPSSGMAHYGTILNASSMTCMIFLLWLVASALATMATFLCRAIYLLFILCSLITSRVGCSSALISTITPSYKRWSTSNRITAMFSPTPFKVLTVGLLVSFFVVSSPSGSTVTLEAFMHSILATFDVPITKIVNTVPACDVQVSNSCSPVWMDP